MIRAIKFPKTRFSLGAQKNLFTSRGVFFNRTPTVLKRSIVHVAELAGSYQSLKEKELHFSPIHGAAFEFTGELEKLYNRAEKEPDLATHQLVRALFFRQQFSIRQTVSLSMPAVALTPDLLAKILFHLDNSTLASELIREKIVNEWREKFKHITKSRISHRKINELIEMILLSKKENSANKNHIRLTEVVLLCFLYHKVTGRDDIILFLKTLHDLGDVLQQDELFALRHKDESITSRCNLYPFTFKNSKKNELVNYEEKLLAWMSSDLSRVAVASYSYQDQPAVPNCVEASYHNLFNLLLYNAETRLFDFKLLPNTLKPHPRLIQFYEEQNFSCRHVNSRKVGSAFMKMLSGHDCLSYHKNDYELNATTKNFLPIMNLFFGCKAKSLFELSEIFSDKYRQVNFNLSIGECSESISITLRMPNKDPMFFSILFTGMHCELLYDGFLRKKQESYKEWIVLLDNSLKTHNMLFYSDKYEEWLQQAIYAGETEALQTLLEIGANPNVLFPNGYTPLWLAVKYINSSAKVLQLLIDYGADMHAKNSIGDTLLHFVCRIRKFDYISKLIELGADCSILSRRGLTPYAVLKQTGEVPKEIEQIFEQAERQMHIKNRR